MNIEGFSRVSGYCTLFYTSLKLNGGLFTRLILFNQKPSVFVLHTFVLLPYLSSIVFGYFMFPVGAGVSVQFFYHPLCSNILIKFS